MNNCVEVEIEDEEKYSQKEEIGYRSKAQKDFIHLLYKDMLKNFMTKWKSLSSHKNICVNKPTSLETEEETEETNREFVDNINLTVYTKDYSLEKETEEENNFKDDEKYEILFSNGNSYSGKMKRDMMEGIGSYYWRHGAQYEGEFQENSLNGKGHLIWKDNSWYEGEFLNSVRHGKGTMINKDFSRFYTGNWYMGHKNGSGLCHYGEQEYYDGMWVMGKRQGMGYRVYPNGSVYLGHWENDLRHGVGTMVWPNGDIYRGEWTFDQMHGYGEYIWNGYFNKTLSWPQENSYMGQWYRGLRHGKGLLKLNSAGGAKYSGMWNEDKKDSYGILIGNDGSSLEMNPLFQKDILIPNRESNESEENSECQEESSFIKKPSKILDPVEINHLNPEQWPLLSKFMRHLAIPKKEIDSITEIQRCEKCNTENKDSCNCLMESLHKEINQSTSVENDIDCNIENRKKLLEQEEIFLRHSLTTHMPRLRKIYEIYTKVYCSNEKVSPYLSMSRMSLWQLWRDCDIHKKNISLIQIDNFISASSKKTLIETKHGPFESIEIWQFLFALLELSWELYSKYENFGATRRLAGGFCKLLELDIFPNAGNHSGKIFNFGVDFLPLAIYRLYRNIGEPHSVKKLLKAACSSVSSIGNYETSLPIRIPEGKNANTVGERICFIPKPEPLINSQPPSSPKELPNNRDLSAFRELGPTQFLSVVSIVCPSIKDEELNFIINIDYELTFLEFYEILLEATIALLKRRKIREQKRLQMIQKAKEETDVAETVSLTSLSTRLQSHTSISTKKGEKVNNNNKKKKQK